MGGHSSDDHGEGVFNLAICIIFCREFLEGAIIIGNYRTVINKSEEWDDERKKQALKTVTIWSLLAAFVAAIVVIAVAVPLGILGNELDEAVVEVIEGVSKVVASICIVQLSVKIPQWLGMYWKVSILPWKKKDTKPPEELDLTLNEIRFNVAWNIWREMAECGVFLIPFFLDSGAGQIPVSAIVGIVIALVLGGAIYIANHKLENKFWLAFFMSGLTLFLAVGLFVGGCHEFEEVWGETKKVWYISKDGWSHNKLPMVILKPFGYSSSRTVLQITTFWLFLAVGLGYHYLKWSATQTAKANYEAKKQQEEPVKDVEEGAKMTTREDSNEAGSEEQEA